MPPTQTTAELGLFTEEGITTSSCINITCYVLCPVLPEGEGALKKDVEALIVELDKIKQDLK